MIMTKRKARCAATKDLEWVIREWEKRCMPLSIGDLIDIMISVVAAETSDLVRWQDELATKKPGQKSKKAASCA